jgi:hypothetical protein
VRPAPAGAPAIVLREALARRPAKRRAEEKWLWREASARRQGPPASPWEDAGRLPNG